MAMNLVQEFGDNETKAAADKLWSLMESDGVSYNDPSGSAESSPSRTDEAGGCKSILQVEPGIAPEPKPPEWRDTAHEEDGGMDAVGPRPQDGRDMLREEMMVVMTKNGEVQAWDEVSGKPLDPQLVAEARKVEMQYFESMGVYTSPQTAPSLNRGYGDRGEMGGC